jgi:glycosyltransferase involved in cell wall biosynthesis
MSEILNANYDLRNNSNPKIAIVHDWFVGGGAEKVVLAMHELYPDAPIYTSYCSDDWREKLDGKVITGYLQKWPFGPMRKYLPVLRIKWFENLDLTAYDIVISSSGNGEAKGVKKLKKGAVHIWYCHSPTHFYWAKYNEYMKNPGFGFFNPLARLSLKILVGPLRKWDYKASQRPNYVLANSSHIKANIKKYYGRDSEVIYPPVNLERFDKPTSDTARKGFVTIGRQTPYKRTDIIVDACTTLSLPLTVLGGGPEHEKLKKRAGNSVTFLHNPTDAAVEQTLAESEGFIFAAEEDFGITPVEAMASGIPVIAYKAGGALDYVNKHTGAFFTKQSSESLVSTLKKFKSSNYPEHELKKQAAKFSTVVFKKKLQQFITQKTN